MNPEELSHTFIDLYGESSEPIGIYFSPGRVNLIGEHTDYNGGHVFPCALTVGTYLLIRPNHSRTLSLATTNFDHRVEIDLDQPFERTGKSWTNYPVGVINEFRKLAMEIDGLDMLFSGNIPSGAGLSSSASIEMVTGFALNDSFQFGLERMELVKLGQRAENLFVGVDCGIMDQFASGMGVRNKALFINCDTLEYKEVPLRLIEMKIIIANTNKRRGLADSKYNERRGECNAALSSIRNSKNIRFLSEISTDELFELSTVIENQTLIKRARHVISENERTLHAVAELNAGNIETFGQLMNASHDSLRDDYEVTGVELDTLVEEAMKIDGTIGTRMTGAGFGGCTVSIVRKDSIEEFIREVGEKYYKKIGLTADFYVAEIGDGSRRVE